MRQGNFKDAIELVSVGHLQLGMQPALKSSLFPQCNSLGGISAPICCRRKPLWWWLSKARIYECSRMSLGVILLLWSFHRTVVLGFTLGPQAFYSQVLCHQSRMWVSPQGVEFLFLKFHPTPSFTSPLGFLLTFYLKRHGFLSSSVHHPPRACCELELVCPVLLFPEL